MRNLLTKLPHKEPIDSVPEMKFLSEGNFFRIQINKNLKKLSQVNVSDGQ
jgi:hypothetical protein